MHARRLSRPLVDSMLQPTENLSLWVIMCVVCDACMADVSSLLGVQVKRDSHTHTRSLSLALTVRKKLAVDYTLVPGWVGSCVSEGGWVPFVLAMR